MILDWRQTAPDKIFQLLQILLSKAILILKILKFTFTMNSLWKWIFKIYKICDYILDWRQTAPDKIF